MKVAVCTLCINDWYQEIVKYGLKTIQNYAQRHGYDFYVCNEVYDGSRDCPWYKIKAIQKILSNYDFVFWFDSDGHVMKPERKVEYFLQKFLKDKDLLCTKDCDGVLNTGLMILRNSPFIHCLLKEVWDNKAPFDKDFHEQASLSQIFLSNRLNSKRKIEIIPFEQQYELFSYWVNYFPGLPFFVHVARCSGDRQGFMYTLDTYCPIKMDEDTEGEYEDRVEWLGNIERCRKDIQGWIKQEFVSRVSTRTMMYREKIKMEKSK